jgi:hypothetical protein
LQMRIIRYLVNERVQAALGPALGPMAAVIRKLPATSNACGYGVSDFVLRCRPSIAAPYHSPDGPPGHGNGVILLPRFAAGSLRNASLPWRNASNINNLRAVSMLIRPRGVGEFCVDFADPDIG